jgi:hypothetical protein
MGPSIRPSSSAMRSVHHRQIDLLDLTVLELLDKL